MARPAVAWPVTTLVLGGVDGGEAEPALGGIPSPEEAGLLWGWVALFTVQMIRLIDRKPKLGAAGQGPGAGGESQTRHLCSAAAKGPGHVRLC